MTERKREKAGEREEEDGKIKQNTGSKNNPTGCKNSQKYWTVFDCDLHCGNSQITEELLPPHGKLKDLI